MEKRDTIREGAAQAHLAMIKRFCISALTVLAAGGAIAAIIALQAAIYFWVFHYYWRTPRAAGWLCETAPIKPEMVGEPMNTADGWIDRSGGKDEASRSKKILPEDVLFSRFSSGAKWR
jgi:hypothetical protein